MFIQPEQLPGAVLLQNLVLKTRLLWSRPSLLQTADLAVQTVHLVAYPYKILLQHELKEVCGGSNFATDYYATHGTHT